MRLKLTKRKMEINPTLCKFKSMKNKKKKKSRDVSIYIS